MTGDPDVGVGVGLIFGRSILLDLSVQDLDTDFAGHQFLKSMHVVRFGFFLKSTEAGVAKWGRDPLVMTESPVLLNLAIVICFVDNHIDSLIVIDCFSTQTCARRGSPRRSHTR